MRRHFWKVLAAAAAALCLAAGLAACTPSAEATPGQETPDEPGTPEEQTLTLTLDAQGGELDAASVTVEVGESAALPTPEKNGYLFDGWYFSAEEGAQAVTEETVFTQSVTLYAHYTLRFSYEGEADFSTFDFAVGDNATYLQESVLYYAPAAEVERVEALIEIDGVPLGSNSNNTVDEVQFTADGENTRITFSFDWLFGRAGEYSLLLRVTRTDGNAEVFTQSFAVEETAAQAGDVLRYFYLPVSSVSLDVSWDDMSESDVPPDIAAARTAYLVAAVWYVGSMQGEVSAACSGLGDSAQTNAMREEGVAVAAAAVYVGVGGDHVLTLSLSVGEQSAQQAAFTFRLHDRLVVGLSAQDVATQFEEGAYFSLGQDGYIEASFDDGTQGVLSESEYTVEVYGTGSAPVDLAEPLAGGTYTVSITAQYGAAYDSYEITVTHTHVWGETSFNGLHKCGVCGEESPAVYSAALADTITAEAWGSEAAIADGGSSLAQRAGSGFTYGTLLRGQTTAFEGTFDEVTGSAAWDTPLVGFYTGSSGVLLRMDNWTIREAPDGLFSNPESGDCAPAYGRAPVGTNEWVVFRTGDSWNAADAVGGAYTLEYYFDHSGILTVTQTIVGNGVTLEQVNSVWLPREVTSVNLFLYGEDCSYTLSKVECSINRVLFRFAYIPESSYDAGATFDFSGTKVEILFDEGERILSADEYAVYTETTEGVRTRLTENTRLTTDMVRVVIVWGRYDFEFELDVAGTFYTPTVEGTAYLNAPSRVRVNFGQPLSEGMILSVGGDDKWLSQIRAGDALGGLTVAEINLTAGFIDFTVPALLPASGQLTYSVELIGGRYDVIATVQIGYSAVLSAEGSGYVQAQNGMILSGTAQNIYLFVPRSAFSEGAGGLESVMQLRFAVKDKAGAERAPYEFHLFEDDMAGGCAALMDAIRAFYPLDACGGSMYLVVFDAQETGGALELVGEGETPALYTLEGEVLTRHTAQGEAAAVRAATCGERGIAAYRAGEYLFGISYIDPSGEHAFAGEGTQQTCSECGAQRERIAQGGEQYDAILPPASFIVNTDLSEVWWNEGGGTPVGRDLLGLLTGNFLVRFTWTQTGDSRQMYGAAQLWHSERGFWTLQGNGSVDGDMTAQTDFPAAIRLFTKTVGEETQSTEAESNAALNPYLTWDESDYDGSYTLTVRRIGSELYAELVFAAEDGAVYTVTCTQSGFPTDGVMCFLAGNPCLAQDVALSVGTLTPVSEDAQ